MLDTFLTNILHLPHFSYVKITLFLYSIVACKMNKFLTLLPVLLMACISTYAQAYFSATPIDNGSFEISEKLIGTWREQKNMGAGRSFTIVADPNKKGHFSITSGLGAITPGILSKAGGHLYLNLYEYGGKDQPTGFHIYLVELPGESIKLAPLKYDLQLPEGMSLTDYLDQPDLDISAITTGQFIWLNQAYTTETHKLDTAGRKINIRSRQ